MQTKYNQDDPRKIASAALQVFFSLSKEWDLSTDNEQALLGFPVQEQFFSWKKFQTADSLSDDILERISYLMNIHKSLVNLLPSSGSPGKWLKVPNNAPILSGETALNKMLSGNIEDISEIYRYLDSESNS